jgi:hypothetical protein
MSEAVVTQCVQYPATSGALMAQAADEVEGSFTVLNNVHGHQVVDPYADIDFSKTNIQGETPNVVSARFLI